MKAYERINYKKWRQETWDKWGENFSPYSIGPQYTADSAYKPKICSQFDSGQQVKDSGHEGGGK